MSDPYAAPAALEDFVSIPRNQYRDLHVTAELGRVLGRNIERAAAFFTLAFSLVVVLAHPTGAVYGVLVRLMPIEVWGWVLGVLAAARGVTLIVNGWWPVTLQVRVSFSVATLFAMWGALTVAFWFVSVNPDNPHSAYLPGVMLAPFAAVVEVLCFLSLRTRMEAARGAKAADAASIGRSAGGDGDGDRGGASGAGERLRQAH